MRKITPLVFLALIVSGFTISCAGRNVHSDISDKEPMLERKWTLMSQNEVTADGERGAEHSNAVWFENTLVYGVGEKGLTSLYVGNHEVRWELPIPHGVQSQILLDRSTIFFGGGDGFLYSVNAETGRVNWRYSLHNPIISKPAIKSGRLFITASDDSIYAFDAGTGKWLWHYRRRAASSATILGASQPLVDGNEVIAGLSDGYIVSLGVDDGALKWEKKLHDGKKFTDVDAHPVLDEGVLYVPSYDGTLSALRRANHEPIWKMDSGASHAVVVEGANLFYPSSDGTIYSLAKSTGKVNWKFDLDNGIPTELAVTDTYIFVGSSYRYFYMLDKSSGMLLGRYDAGYGSGFNSSPVWDTERKRVYILSGGGNLYAFQVAGLTSKRLK